MSFLNSLTGYPAGKQYSITTGSSRSLTLGSGATSWPPSGWVDLNSISRDDVSLNVPLGFDWYFNGTSYNSVWVCSNMYVTFGSSATTFSPTSTNPALNKIFFQAADRSYQRLAYQNASDSTYTRIRVEGTGAPSGTPGSPTVTYEMTFFNPANTGYVPLIEMLVGLQGAGAGLQGAYTAGGTLLGFSSGFSAGTSYYIKQTNFNDSSWTSGVGYVNNSGY